MRLYEGLSTELGFNLLFSQQGHLTLAHTDRAMFVMNERAEVNQLVGIDSRVISPEEIAKLAPAMSLKPDAVYPVMGALYSVTVKDVLDMSVLGYQYSQQGAYS